MSRVSAVLLDLGGTLFGYQNRDQMRLPAIAALERLDTIDGAEAINLGTGRGYSVLDVIEAASKAVGRDIPYEIVGRRTGDIAATWADPKHAREMLGWEAQLTMDDIAADHWRWQSQNPEGYATSSGDDAKVE